MKVGDLVKFKDNWKESLRTRNARMLASGFTPTAEVQRVDKLAIVVQDWDTHDNFAVIFNGETEIVDFNGYLHYSNEIMEKA